MKILLFSASTRKDGLNMRLISRAHQAAVEADHEAVMIALGDYEMPFYNGDWEAENSLPDTALTLKKMIAEADALMVSTPEYNGGFPGLLKNTLDWCSRAGGGLDGRATFEGTKCIVMAATPGKMAGVRVLPKLVQQMQDYHTTVTDHFGVGNADEDIDSAGTTARINQALATLTAE